jgi:hypothetical protein
MIIESRYTRKEVQMGLSTILDRLASLSSGYGLVTAATIAACYALPRAFFRDGITGRVDFRRFF